MFPVFASRPPPRTALQANLVPCLCLPPSPPVQHYKQLLSPRTRLVSLVHVSNVLGAVLDTDFVVEEARKVRKEGSFEQ